MHSVLDEPYIASKGSWGTVLWASASSGAIPQALKFFNELDGGEKAKSFKLFQWLAEIGKITNREKFRALGQDYGPAGRDLFEFKSFQVRFLGAFRRGQRFVIARGLRKKKDRHDKSDLEAAQRILAEYDASHPAGESGG